MFNTNGFAQVLEGSHDQIQETFERIQCDPRHSLSSFSISNLCLSAVSLNGQWPYIGHEVLAAKKFMQIQKESGFDVGRLSGDRIYDLPQMHLYATQQENTIKVD
ncbi:MAG: hypothetical protein NMNS02_29310 [Nitrosomonas sp.]|nr:MAG: hypothetical protein NMNS02_29310 [Nitrosomonas sp.]